MKKITYTLLLLFFTAVAISAPWRGKLFIDAKKNCVYGLGWDKLGRNYTRRVCVKEKGKAKLVQTREGK